MPPILSFGRNHTYILRVSQRKNRSQFQDYSNSVSQRKISFNDYVFMVFSDFRFFTLCIMILRIREIKIHRSHTLCSFFDYFTCIFASNCATCTLFACPVGLIVPSSFPLMIPLPQAHCIAGIAYWLISNASS